MPQKSCGVVLWSGDPGAPRFLIVRAAAHGHWEFAKGHVDCGEDERQTALRELEEETGVSEVTVDPAFRESIQYTVQAPHGRDEKTVVFFLAHARDERFKLSSEHSDGEWVPAAEVRERFQHDNYKRILDAATDHLKDG